MMGVGFLDHSCAPSAVYCIYNELQGPKLIFDKILNGHGDTPPEYDPLLQQWLRTQMLPRPNENWQR